MKPGDFLIGIRDFFAILVPGATFLMLLPFGFIGDPGKAITAMQVFGLTIIAYLVGSVASALGSGLDFIVDGVLESSRFRGRFGRKLLRRERLANRLRCQLLREHTPCMTPARHPETVKSFWWTHLRLNCPAAVIELDRLEAMQKLFRSLVAVFSVVAIIYALSEEPRPVPRVGPRTLAVAALLAGGFYAGGRYAFLAAVYRLAGAYCLTRQKAAAG